MFARHEFSLKVGKRAIGQRTTAFAPGAWFSARLSAPQVVMSVHLIEGERVLAPVAEQIETSQMDINPDR
jgi:hypothetical protein